MQQSIAVLDSGVGGLTVVKQIMRQLPNEHILYFGDTARTPYGPRSADEVIYFTQQMVNYLMQFQPKMIVIACNTATAVALETIRQQVKIPVMGVIIPGARAAVQSTLTGKIGVIGTEGTIRSQAYVLALKDLSAELEVHSLACPLFVPLVERGLFNTDEVKDIVRTSLTPLMDKAIDSLILGCTHYPFLSEVISEVVGLQTKLISSADETAREVHTILQASGKTAVKDQKRPTHLFFCSGDHAMFSHIAEMWLGWKVDVTLVGW